MAPALLMAYRVLGCTRPVLLLVGAVQMMFLTPAARATPAVITADTVSP